MEAKPNNDKLTILRPSMPLSRWLAEQVTVLAEIFGESMTPARLKGYVASLSDLDTPRLRDAFVRAPHELKFFPKPAELRELAGVPKPGQREQVEAEAAFNLVVFHLERNGVDAGVRSLPERVQYAVRACGGLDRFNRRLQVHYGDDENPSEMEDYFTFLQRDFAEAYKNSLVHDEMDSELAEKGLIAWPKRVRLFLAPRPMDAPKSEPRPTQMAHVAVAITIKKVPESLTDAQLRDRREMLRQQRDLLQK